MPGTDAILCSLTLTALLASQGPIEFPELSWRLPSAFGAMATWGTFSRPFRPGLEPL